MQPFMSTYKPFLLLAATSFLPATLTASPDGPSQQCLDDAGPPWGDDCEHFGEGGRYHDNTPASPHLNDGGSCPTPLIAACAAKPAKAAFLEGPVDCGGEGWFCRILPQPGWYAPEYEGTAPGVEFSDRNFAHCNGTDADERDDDGHCHGSDTESTYGWWIRDHWYRGYAGRLSCCCGWGGVAMQGVVNRCDYRHPVGPDSPLKYRLGSCRDANEYHGTGYEDGCALHQSSASFGKDPLYNNPGTCWEVSSFANPEAVDSTYDGEEDEEEDDEEGAVVVALTASGNLADYIGANAAALTAVCDKIAVAGGLTVGDAACTVAAGSVIITAALTVPAGTTVASVTSALSTALGTTALASSVLGITVTSAPTIEGESHDDGGLSSGLLAGIIIGALVGVAAIGALVYITMVKGSSTTKAPA